MARPSFFARLWLALVTFFRIVFDAEFAAEVTALRAPHPPVLQSGGRATLPATPRAISTAEIVRSEQALRLTAMLQREGRLIDFCEEELTGFSDAQIGAAARPVHDGCRKAKLQIVSLTGGLLWLSKPVDQGSHVKLMFLTQGPRQPAVQGSLEAPRLARGRDQAAERLGRSHPGRACRGGAALMEPRRALGRLGARMPAAPREQRPHLVA